MPMREHLSEPWLKLAYAELGTKEIPGPDSNPTVEQYYRDAVKQSFRDDVPWCAAFVGSMLRRAGYASSGSLWARSYLNWGVRLNDPKPGAITILSRGNPSQGHVGFFIGKQGNDILLLGGNQRDAVTIAHYPRSRVLGYRWPIAKTKEKVNGNETT